MKDRKKLAMIEGRGFGKSLWTKVGKAMHDYDMIEEGDRIAVGISGGKDSMTVLNAIYRVRQIANIDFEIIPIHIHSNTDKETYAETKKYIEDLGLSLQVEETNLEEILFGDEKQKNPCFLCGRIRRGILYRMMKEQNINKLALGHHKDDIIETFLMNVFYQGNMKMMKPSYTSKEYGVRVIRPLAYVEEKDIKRYIKRQEIPVTPSNCPYETSDNSKRLRIKKLIDELASENKDFRSVIMNSIKPML